MATETPARDLWSSIVFTYGNGASWDQWTSLEASFAFRDTVGPTCIETGSFFKVGREADRTTKRNFCRTSAMFRQQDIKCERYVAVVIDIVICVYACADLPMIEKLETFLTISDDDDGNFTKCCHDHVLYRREQYSHVIVYVREQCCHMDSERVVSNDRWWQLRSL